MAPTAPTKRRSLRAKVASKAAEPYAPKRAPRPDAAPIAADHDSFATGSSKRDRRQIKHASFVSRIETSGVKKSKPLKRRRPGKKLVANLDSLADALPELLEGEGEEGLQSGKMRHKSLKSRKGALKRKEKIVKGEVERFGVSLARLNTIGASEAPVIGGDQAQTAAAAAAGEGQTMAGAEAAMATQAPPAATSSRWAALRGFISATMEQNPAFVERKPGV